MSEETNIEGEILYKCLRCGWIYRDRLTADECEVWCMKHKSCNIDIVKDAIKLNQ
ncbi:MAG: hypothetical protein AABX23_01840 [Nanoarchaeota archaeon]